MTLPETFVDIRLSHLLRDCSVGAIVRHDQALMVVQDTRYWDGPRTSPHERELRYVDLVRKGLGLGDTKLCRPPVKEQEGDRIRDWVPARRFPGWTRCSRCGLLHHEPWKRGGIADPEIDEAAGARRTPAATKSLRCGQVGEPNRGRSRCGGLLEQVPWVLVHEDGYLADVPWHEIAHSNSKRAGSTDCAPNRKEAVLKIRNRQGRWWVRCTREGCGAKQRLPDRFPYGQYTPQQPWVQESPPEPPSQPGLLIGVNDVRVHFAECATALVIPPESRIRRGSVVDRLYSSSADQDLIRTARNGFARQSRYRELATKYGATPEEVEEAFESGDAVGPALPLGDLEQLEYGALTQPIPDLQPDEDFVTEHYPEALRHLDGNLTGPSAGIAAAVEQLVAVHRLKEIMVFKGFRRGQAEDTQGRAPTPPDIVGESDWLPALELWGEGLFFSLKEELVARWEAQASVQTRAEAVAKRAGVVHLPGPVTVISPRLLLCHTLAHLIIRCLESEAGYPAASLKERIYCASHMDRDEAMAGVLIYVAVADTHGSLGGLMDMARPDRFLRLLTGALEDASWCSFDPVCREQEGHGPDLLNRAACHACALVPEPSCVCGNRLLDRVFVAGDGETLRSLWDLAASGPRQ